MPYALQSKTEERPAPADASFAISDLWMLPILLLALIFDKFSRHLTRLKDMRRSRPMPKDWRSFYPELRACEWAIRMFCFEGARQLILGGELDLRSISFDHEPPEDFAPPVPRSALAMHQRIADTARFHADPERYVRRHAERIRARKDDDDDSAFPNPATTTISPRRPFGAAAMSARSHPAAIRGPP